MMTAASDWDEVKRLAADFQKAQLSSTTQRLSERNCIEVVTKLIELKLLDVIFTTDGKEYLTHQQLTREIKDELYVSGGRINTVDLAKELNIDLALINASVSDIVRSKEIFLISGHLISLSYLEKIAREINERIVQQGQIKVGDLTLHYDLPADLLQHNVLEKYLNKIIFAKQDPADPRIFYTESFITRSKAKIRGALVGLLKPTPVAVILNQCNLSERLFHTLFDQVNAPGSVTGRQTGAQYVPHCYTKAQIQWTTSFFKQNNYLEYDALTRLGISDPKIFFKRHLPEIAADPQCMYLQSCIAGSHIIHQIQDALEECIVTKSYLDIATVLPSVFNDEDYELLLEKLLKNNQRSTILFHTTVLSTAFIEKLSEQCIVMANEKAESVVQDGSYQKFNIDKQLAKLDTSQNVTIDFKAERREERRKKAAGGKGGGGTQGRETKTKSVKKHLKSSKNTSYDSDSDDNNSTANTNSTLNTFQIVTVKDIEQKLSPILDQEGLDDLITPIAKYLHPTLNQVALSTAKTLSDKVLQSATQNLKQTHSSVQDKINSIVNDIRLYEKGYKLFPVDQQPQFLKYLLKSMGGDVVSELCKYVAQQCNLQSPSGTLTAEQRLKIINDSTDEYKKSLRLLNSALSSDQNLEQFQQALDACLSACGMIIKKVDKKKDRVLIHNHKEKLLEELSGCDDPALVLHLASLAIFTAATQHMLHASGRQVSVILSFLNSYLKEEQRKELMSYHDLVLKFLNKNEESEHSSIGQELDARIKNIKLIANEYKKQSVEKP